MAKRKMTPEEWAEREARSAEVTRIVEARIAFHTAKIAEERAEAEARAQRRRKVKRLLSLGLLGGARVA